MSHIASKQRHDFVLAAARDLGLRARLARAVARVAQEEPTGALLPEQHPVVACDLDRTLVYSSAALDLGGLPLPALSVAEVTNGQPVSYWTLDARRLLEALMRVATFVPTTTRTPEQYARVRLPSPPRYAITSNGGRLLVDGVPCKDWSAHVSQQMSMCAPLGEVADHMRRVASPRWVHKHRIADGLFTYLVVERDLMPNGFVRDLSVWCAERSWCVSMQDRKLYVIPTALTKWAAVSEVARRTGTGTVLAAGDSLLDRDLLELADAGVRPAHGELHSTGWVTPHVTVTEHVGVRAGQEIVVRLLAYALLRLEPRVS